MFAKLMKYEMKSLGRSLLPLYGVVLFMAFLNFVCMSGSNRVPFITNQGAFLVVAMTMVYFALCVAVAVLTIMTVVQRFCKGLLGNEGYLMHTLPVSPAKLVLSKLTGATLMAVLSIVVGILSVFILTMGDFVLVWEVLFDVFQNTPWVLSILEGMLVLVLTLASKIAQLYLAMALGHLSNTHRAAMSFVWYLVIAVALSLLGVGFFSLLLGTGLENDIASLAAQIGGPWGIHLALLSQALLGLGMTALFTFGTTWVLKKKLNLE